MASPPGQVIPGSLIAHTGFAGTKALQPLLAAASGLLPTQPT
jgi:hypothetical protein